MPKRVFYIDDDRDDRMFLKESSKILKTGLECFERGERPFERLQANSRDVWVIVLDINMPYGVWKY